MKTNHILTGIAQAITSRLPRLDTLSIVSRQSFLGILFVFLTTLGVGNAWGAETVYKTAKFGSSASSCDKCNNYTSSWSSTYSGFSVTVNNGNNNNNGWNHVRFGSKSAASTGSIVTGAIDKKVTKVSVTLNSVNTTYTTSIKLYTSNNGSSWTERGTYTQSTGAQNCTIPVANQAANLYYKVEIVCTKSTESVGNGFVQIAQVDYYVETFTVSYNANGGSGTMTDSSSPYLNGASVTVKSNSFTAPDGYTFDHWDTKSDDSGTDYDAGDKFNISANTTLYAQWEADATVAVTGVEISPTSKAIVVGETFTITPTVSPSNATDKSVSWSSNATSYATVSSGTVTGVAAGSATITCTTTDGSFTDDCDVDVYSVTVQVKDEDNNTLSGAGMPTASASGRTLTASAKGNNYAFKQWETVTAAGTSFASSTSASTTLNGTPTGNVTIKAVYYKPINVTWKVGDGDASGGTAQVAYNTKISSLPTSPDDDDLGDCADTFMGWSGTNLGSNTGNSAPSDLFTSTNDAGVQALTSDQIYYAVFATASGGDVEWVLTDIDDLTSSDIFVLAESASEYAMTNDNGTSAAPGATTITVVSNKITSTVNANMQWNISGNGSDGYVFYPNGSSTTWLYCSTTDNSGSNNNLRVGDGDRKLFVLDASGELVTNDTYVDRYIRLYSTTDFRSYINKDYGYAVAPKCYKKTGGYTYSDYMTLCCTSPGSLSETFYESSDDEATVKWSFPVDASSNKKQAGVYVHLYADNAGAVGDEITAKKADYHDDNSTVSHTFTGLTASTSYWFTIEGVGRTVGGVNYCGADESTPIKFTTQPSCSSYSFHYGTDGSGGWITECFGDATDHVRTISDFTIPSTTHFYVGKQNAWDASTPGNADKANSVVTAWSGLYFDASIGDGDRPMVGQATGAVGTLKIIDNSTWNNKKASFIPDGYVLKFNTTEYPLSVVSGNQFRTDFIEYNSTSARYNVSVGIEDADGDFVSTANTQAMQHIFLNTGGTDLWSKDNATYFGLYDISHSQFTCLMVAVPGEEYMYEGWVPSDCEQVIFVRLKSSTLVWGDANANVNNKTGDISLADGKNLFTITTWNDQTTGWTAYEQLGKFRIDADYTDKNWYARFVPYNKLTYANGGGTGTTPDPEYIAKEATGSDLDVTLPANPYTKSGYHFVGWNDGSSTYDAGATYTLTADKTLTAEWEINTYTITYNKGTYGTGSAIADGTKTHGIKYTISSSTYSRTGYTQEGWATSDGGDKEYDFGDDYTTNADLDLYPYWEAITTEITLNKTSGGKDGLAYAQYDESTIVVEDATAPTGYHLEGYYTNDATPVKIIKADGTLAADNITNYVTDGKWSYASTTLTLYAQWEITSYTLAWSKNADDADDLTGSYTTGSTDYNSALTAPTTPTRTGWTFDSWNTATDGSGDDYTGYMPAANTTYYAQWIVNQYKMNVSAPKYVTITATVSESAKGEDSETDVDYGTTVTLNYTDKTDGYYWGGWTVTKTSDGTAVDISGSGDGATFTMPAYDVTITAVIYGNLKAWCDPDITIDGDIYLTSYKDIYVNSTSATNNLINIKSTDLGGVTSFVIGYLDGTDTEVVKSSSLFRLCNDGTSNYNMVDASSTTIDVSESNEYDQNYSIRYTPNEYGQLDNGKLQITMKKGTRVVKTVTKELHGRSLPEEFVIAVKKDNQWFALPNNLASTGSQPSIVPLKITVDDDDTPTAASYAATTTVYKATGRNTVGKYINGIRFTTTGSNWLQTAKADGTYNMWLSESNSDSAQVWYLSSTDFGAYTLKMDTKHNGTKKMGIYTGGYMGFHGSPSASDIYLLPITNKYTDVPATVHEWGEHGAILNATMTDVASATMHVDNGTPADVSLTAVNAASLTAGKYVRVYNEDVTVGDVANEGKQLYVHWKDEGGDEIGVSQITIPCVVASSNDMKSIASTKAAWSAKSEVHVLPGVTLDANASSFAGDGALSVSQMEVYPGATLKVSTGTFNATTLRLRNGWTRAGDKQYNSARVYIADDAALTKTTASMDYDIYEASDGKHYYPLAVPFTTAVSGIDYADTYLAGFSTYGTHYVIKEYDGANRAKNGEDSNNNWDVVSSGSSLTPGKGYIMTAVAVKGEAIIRVPLTFDNGWTNDGEKATYDDVTKNVIAVTAYGGDAATAHTRHKGWNMLGVPFMSSYGAGTDMYSGGGAAALINGELVVNTSADQNMEYQSTTIPYVSVPSHDFAEYVQTDISEAKLLPGWSFFVQVNTTGNLTFAVSNQRPNEDNPIYAPRRSEAEEVVRTGIILSGAETSDKTTILVSDKYNGAEYEIGADLEKMFGDGYTLATYSLMNGTRLVYNAMSKAEAQSVIPIGFRAPANGEYTFSLNPRYANAPFERVDLIDYQTGELTNLMTSAYTFTTERTQNDGRFALNVTPIKNTPTDIESTEYRVQSTDIQKVIIDDKMFIIRDGKMYDATGKKVKGNR